MEVRRVIANKMIAEDNGKVALQMGPIIYCAEWVDNDKRTSNIILPSNADFTTEYKPDLLNGINVLKTNIEKVEVDSVNNKIETVSKPFVAIPYYAWANRGKGEMTIWLNEKIKDVELITGN